MNEHPLDKEVVLLVDEGAGLWRPVVIDPRKHVGTIVEREHLAKNVVHERIWICKNDERCETGQRIFRELLKPVSPEPSENPLFDELVIKKPLPFTWQS